MPLSFDEMDKAEVDPLWANFKEGGYEIVDASEDPEDPEIIADIEGPLVLVLTEVEGNVGENNSRLYTGYHEDYDRPVMFWGTGHINRQVDNAGISEGNEIGILQTDETIDTGQDEPMRVFDVRFS